MDTGHRYPNKYTTVRCNHRHGRFRQISLTVKSSGSPPITVSPQKTRQKPLAQASFLQPWGGEGVFGLRRAFVLAGARTLVISLWKVPDVQTKELMIEFYRRLIGGETVSEALRNAQLVLKKHYPDPFYWGAFVCQGDPSPMTNISRRITGSDTNC